MNTIRTETGYQLDDMHVNAKPYSRLPTQQARTLLLVAKGLPQKSIANVLGVKLCTVRQACNELSFKFNTHSMRQTVHQAIKQGVLRYTVCILLCLISTANNDLERSFRTIRVARTVRTTRLRRMRELQNDLLEA
ncbi:MULTISPECIES: LuxR C-terminal-related transcriptional regulator [unclassified Pseudoalteromonas]|uniref:helix-turn-helix transcriptional regulator n=1 Tax=unclassified Pseudoalteromonas TaxID=194690 RepID=UPI0004190FAB|nr:MULTISPECIES: LuxR C-terminal-related transcriptional regulator [unclassified Pseudoalteromonas]